MWKAEHADRREQKRPFLGTPTGGEVHRFSPPPAALDVGHVEEREKPFAAVRFLWVLEGSEAAAAQLCSAEDGAKDETVQPDIPSEQVFASE